MAADKRHLPLFLAVIAILFTILILLQCAKDMGTDPSADDDDDSSSSATCSSSSSIVTSQASIQNPVFNNTWRVEIYLITNQGRNPSFVWNETGAMMLVLAVFSNKIDINPGSGRVNNTDDVVWMWASDFTSGSDGRVDWPQGREVVSAAPVPGVPPELDVGVYYYGLWGYNRSGEIDWSSCEYQYVYTNTNL